MHLKPFLLEKFLSEFEFSVRHLLCASDCESFSIKEILELEPESRDMFQSLYLGYAETQGDPELRYEISQLYKDFDPEDILVHSGAQEAIFNFMVTHVDTGYHAIVQYPAYQSLYESAKATGAEVSFWKSGDGFSFDPEDIKKLIRENTKVLVINFPHNPTGAYLTDDAYKKIFDICCEHGIIVLSDEVYRFLEYNEAEHLPPACELSDNAVSLGVMSKSFGLPGLRVGWIATKSAKILESMRQMKDYTTISNAKPSEFLAKIALRNQKSLLLRNRKIVNANLEKLHSFMEKREEFFSWVPPQAGPVAFPALVKQKNTARFCDILQNEYGILLAPGHLFGEGYGAHFRIGFGRKNFKQGLMLLDECLDQVLGKVLV